MKASVDHRASLEKEEFPASMDLLDQEERTDHPGLMESLDHREPRDRRDTRDLRGLSAFLDREVFLALRGTREAAETPASPDPPAPMAGQASVASRASPVPLDNLERLALPETRVRLDLWENRVPRE